MAGAWLVGRVGPDEIGPRLDEMADWIRGLGVDPTHMKLVAAVVQTDAGYELHLTELVLSPCGRPHLDFALDQPVTRPVIVPITAGSWPAWITGARGRAAA